MKKFKFIIDCGILQLFRLVDKGFSRWNFFQLLEVFEDDLNIYLILELCATDMQKYLNIRQQFTEDESREFVDGSSLRISSLQHVITSNKSSVGLNIYILIKFFIEIWNFTIYF